MKKPWSAQYDTVKREKLFRHPPKDKSAYPMLQETVRLHIDSFNALFDRGGLIELALQDIGSKTIFDGASNASHPLGNRLTCMFLYPLQWDDSRPHCQLQIRRFRTNGWFRQYTGVIH